MSDELRWKRYAERRRFERAIAAEVQAEREAKQDRALLIRRHAMTNPLCRRLV